MTSSVSHTQGDAAQPLISSPVAYTAISFEDAFWAPRLRTARERTLPSIYKQMKQDGHFGNLRAYWQTGMHRTPYVFWESDISKWLEAASYSLATHTDANLEALVDEAVAFLAGLQQPDGYLNLWYTQVEPEKRWSNLRDNHELYCAGHLIEAAVAHFQATGKRVLLDAVCRYADYIASVFGIEEGKRRGYSGHEEIELALVKLYRATGETRYLQLSRYFVEERGRQPHYFDAEARARGEDPHAFWAQTYEYNQSHLPVREQQKVVGHAVRAMYLACALADLAKELDDETLLDTCERFWQHLSSTQMYVTGGLGPSAANEGFTTSYDLPNDAYAETCAAIGLIMWCHRMLQIDADSRYADVLERALYNGVLSGLALDGERFFYENPLESHGAHHRQSWYKCACCPPNISRLLASLGQYVYGVGETDLLVHLYAQSTSNIALRGQNVVVRQETNYPWEGAIQLSFEMDEPAEFALHLRIPGWCRQATLSVDGEELAIEQSLRKGYARITRRWQSGDRVLLRLDMAVERVYAHPDIRVDNGCVALQRGPLVYCLEAIDNPVPLHRVRLPETAEFVSSFEPTFLGGNVLIRTDALLLETEDWSNNLYRSAPPVARPHALVAIPYYAWDHREAGEMRVWIHV